jgi:leucyl aminopeptidase
MTVPTLALSHNPAIDLAVDVLVLGVSGSDAGPVLHADGAEFDSLREALVAVGITGGRDTVRRFPAIGSAASIALVGIGSGEPTTDSLRYAAGTAARQLVGVESIALALPVTTVEETLAVLEGAAIGAYSFTEFRQASLEATKLPASTITVVSALVDSAVVDSEVTDAGLVERATAVATAVHSVRDLVNIPPSHLYPETFADAVLELSAGLPVEVEVMAEAELAAGGFGGILGVGQGSVRPPRLVVVRYAPEGASKHVAFVGKGITFDTGGLSLKPPASMVGMKYDMTGAATVMAVVLAASKLALPIRLTAWLCIAENMPSGSAVRPNDVLRIRGGRTVEVLNTDAEGRLVLADGIVAASEEYPDAIIDVATLTGAQRVALGDRYSGVMGDDELVEQLVDAAGRSGETFWPMPLPGELRSLINSDVADIANAKIGSTAAGMLLAGVFLQEFVGADESGERIPWAHLDIAGPSNNTGSPYGYTGKGPTGVAVRALLTMTEDISRK